MNIYLIRHGEKNDNSKNCASMELTKKGFEQVNLLGKRLIKYNIKRIYTSDMGDFIERGVNMIGRRIKLLFIFTVLALLLLSSVTAFAAQNTPTIKRLSGDNRYATSASVALNGWTQSDYAILALGEDFADALSAAPLAKKYNAPILLTETNAIPEETLNTINQLKVKSIIIIGGTGVISSAVQDKLNSMGITTSRIFGQDRYETSIKIADQLDNVTEIAVVTGESFSDALSISPIAVKKNMPIVLVRNNEIPTAVKNYINSHKLTKTYVIGTGTSLNSAILTGFNNVELITGKDKYEINLNIAHKFKNDLDLSTVYLATGENFADALSGSILAGSSSSPLILLGNDIGSVKKYFADNLGIISNIKVLGGVGAVTDDVINQIISSSKDSNASSISTASKIEIVSKGLTKTEDNTLTFKYRILDQNGIDITKTIPDSDITSNCVINSISYALKFDPQTGTCVITDCDIKDDNMVAVINLSYKNEIRASDTLCLESSEASKVSKLEIVSKSLTKVGGNTVTFQYEILDQNGADITKTVPASEITSSAMINSAYYAVSLDPTTGTGAVTYSGTLSDNIIATISLSCRNGIHTNATLYLGGSKTQESNTVFQMILYPDSATKTGANTITFRYKILNKNYEDITKVIPASEISAKAIVYRGIQNEQDELVTLDPSTGIGTVTFGSSSDIDKEVSVYLYDKLSSTDANATFNKNETVQKISKIVFTSKVVLDKRGYGYVTYEVEDQDGNDITMSNIAKNIRFKCDVGTVQVAQLGGILTITFNNDVDIDKLTSITLTGYDTDTGFSMSGTLTPQ